MNVESMRKGMETRVKGNKELFSWFVGNKCGCDYREGISRIEV